MQRKTVKKLASAMIPPKDRLPIHELVSTETVRQAFLSPHEAVRKSASFFFSCCRTDDLDVGIMKTVIQSVELYGKIASLAVLDALEVPQDETTVRWLIQELSKEYDLNDIQIDNYCYILTKILGAADPNLLDPEMVDLRCFSTEKKPLFFKRLELAAMDAESLWKTLVHFGSDVDALYENYEYDLDDLLVEAVARHADLRPRVLDALQRKNIDLDDADFDDFQSLLFRIVAKGRIVEARQGVLDEILKADEYYLHEGLEQAFACIAEEDDWETLYSRWKESPEKHGWFVDLLLEKPSRKRLEIAWDLLRTANKTFSDDRLMGFLLENYVKESHPFIADLLDGGMTSHDSWNEHAVSLVVSGILNPDSLEDFDNWFHTAEEIEWDLEEMRDWYAKERLRVIDASAPDEEDWDDEEDEDFDGDTETGVPWQTLSRMDEFIKQRTLLSDFSDKDDGDLGPPQPFRNESPKIGRNDPCPCGSGKKYKKCCLKNS